MFEDLVDFQPRTKPSQNRCVQAKKMIAETPKPPYYAVIFSSIKTEIDNEEYLIMSNKMIELANKQTGFLGIESARNELGITVSYWKDLISIKNWKDDYEHQIAQKLGKSKWYKSYKTRIAKIESDYEYEN